MTKPNPIFAGIEGDHNQFKNANVLLQSISYDGTSTWGKGADQGFEAFLDAAENMEIYDIETDSEVYQKGVHIVDPILEEVSPEAVFESVYENTRELLKTDKFLTFFGGEHSISIGIIKAFYEAHPDITILQLDAHTDLRPEYHGSPYNHACAVYDASQNANLVQVGIRSMDSSELEFLDRDKCYFAEDIHGKTDWMEDSLSKISDKVYITVDLDVFDPSIMPATGTPEPGGMDWYTVTRYLKKVFQQKNVLGFDIVELAPIEGLSAPQFLAAKLYYKMLSYKFANS
ncbi:agmatinase [Gracilimonas mengyeensis]|uniref:Agmatinase n=1 Tax=Gracilimonas mengyeensis TaxID=1302730 RepID=A0A521AE91_9BACT|nr:agmatinase [Gracilimonas mengyeensis]SMO33135.1 agmatinase [Gracilimonas mengyeensis]